MHVPSVQQVLCCLDRPSQVSIHTMSYCPRVVPGPSRRRRPSSSAGWLSSAARTLPTPEDFVASVRRRRTMLVRARCVKQAFSLRTATYAWHRAPSWWPHEHPCSAKFASRTASRPSRKKAPRRPRTDTPLWELPPAARLLARTSAALAARSCPCIEILITGRSRGDVTTMKP